MDKCTADLSASPTGQGEKEERDRNPREGEVCEEQRETQRENNVLL